MPSRSVESSWCLFRGNDKVRDSIKFIMDRKNITAKAICDELGIAPYRMSLYLNNKVPNVNQMQLWKICNHLGISVDINIEIKSL